MRNEGSEWGKEGEKEERSEAGTERGRKGRGNRETEGRRQAETGAKKEKMVVR